VRDLVKQRPQQPAPRGEHRHDRERRAEGRGEAAGEGQPILPGDEGGGEGEERHERQVLKQQHAEGEPAVRAVELGALGELLQQERGRAHGDGPAQHDGDEPADAEPMSEHREQGGGGDDLGGA